MRIRWMHSDSDAMPGTAAVAPSIYSGRTWRFGISPSKGRSAWARRGWPSGWPTGSTARAVLEDADNPFLADFYNERPGAALQAQLFYLLNRHRQLTALRQADLFQHTIVCDYLFDRDKIFAYLNLDDNELFIYQRLYDLLARDIPPPDLVVYLQAPHRRPAAPPHATSRPIPNASVPQPDADYLRELNEAYQHFFFHYTATPLLVVETSQFDPETSDDALDDLVRQIDSMGQGTRATTSRERRTKRDGTRTKNATRTRSAVLSGSRSVRSPFFVPFSFFVLRSSFLVLLSSPHGLVQESAQADCRA